MATHDIQTVQLDLQGTENAAALAIQLSDALLQDTVKLAETARQFRQAAVAVAGRIAEARESRLSSVKVTSGAGFYDGIEPVTRDTAEVILETFRQVKDQSRAALQSWLTDERQQPHSKNPGAGRSVSTTGFFLGPTHGADPGRETNGGAYALRLKEGPAYGSRYVNLGDVLILARIGASILTSISQIDVDEDDSDDVD